MRYPSHCPLCGAPRVTSSLYACIERDDACDPGEIDRVVRVAAQHHTQMDAFLASLPPRYRRYASTPVDAGRLSEKVTAALDEMTEAGFLYLFGDPGVGKTHLVVRQATRLVDCGRSGLFVNEVDYFERVFAEFRGGPPAPDLTLPEVLVYDDLGKQKPSEFALQKLYHMLEMRWEHDRPTLITSNISPQAMGKRLSDDPVIQASLVSRLMAGQAVGLRGQDSRPGSAV